MRDPIVEEICQTCDGQTKQFNYGLDAICDDTRKREEETRKDDSLGTLQTV
jgi:hypothetical protein